MKATVFPVIFFCILFFAGCNDLSKKNLPSGIIPKEKFVHILVDFHLIDAAMSTRQITDNGDNVTVRKYYSSVLKKYDINKESFISSLQFYCLDPAELEVMYDLVLAEISKMEGNSTPKNIAKKRNENK